VCVRVCVRACVRALVRACARVRAHVCVRVCSKVCTVKDCGRRGHQTSWDAVGASCAVSKRGSNPHRRHELVDSFLSFSRSRLLVPSLSRSVSLLVSLSLSLSLLVSLSLSPSCLHLFSCVRDLYLKCVLLFVSRSQCLSLFHPLFVKCAPSFDVMGTRVTQTNERSM